MITPLPGDVDTPPPVHPDSVERALRRRGGAGARRRRPRHTQADGTEQNCKASCGAWFGVLEAAEGGGGGEVGGRAWGGVAGRAGMSRLYDRSLVSGLRRLPAVSRAFRRELLEPSRVHIWDQSGIPSSRRFVRPQLGPRTAWGRRAVRTGSPSTAVDCVLFAALFSINRCAPSQRRPQQNLCTSRDSAM